MARAFIGLGSNLDHPRRQLARAARALDRLPATHVVALSRNYRTAPRDSDVAQPDFVNAVAELETALKPRALLNALHAIERRQRRVRVAGAPRNRPRTLDLDLHTYARVRLATPALAVPHPRITERAFVLVPLAEIAPGAAVPGRGLARRFLRATRGQRVAPTRAHVLR
jgi:2-amino-4-hydroxy-6-hydroxymethyldihydropteridine diphosphokinase